MHLPMVLRPILPLRVPAVHHTQRKLPLLPAYGHPHDRLLRIPHVLGHIHLLLPPPPSPLPLLATDRRAVDFTPSP